MAFLCFFYFSDIFKTKKSPKMALFKTFFLTDIIWLIFIEIHFFIFYFIKNNDKMPHFQPKKKAFIKI